VIFNRFAQTAIREARQISKAELATASEQAPSYITQLEKGDRERPSITAIRRLADALECDPRAFYVEPGVDRLIDELVDRINGDRPVLDAAIDLLTKLRAHHT
jgi:transcriptional regulator with XRE-family HTH domain